MNEKVVNEESHQILMKHFPPISKLNEYVNNIMIIRVGMVENREFFIRISIVSLKSSNGGETKSKLKIESFQGNEMTQHNFPYIIFYVTRVFLSNPSHFPLFFPQS